MIAVALQTCDRPEYTARALASFVEHNDTSAFVCLHGDDASETSENAVLAAAYGFQTVVTNTERRGMIATRLALFDVARSRGASWVLLLENDIETLRPFPWPLFRFVTKQREVYCLRLYGRFKDKHKTERCLDTHKRREHRPVKWSPFKYAPEPSQVGVIHWSAQPAVTRTADLLYHHRTGHEPAGLTVRVKKNVMAHFGTERTPGRLM